MKPAKRIHNLDSLDREIYRLRLEAKNMEKKMDNNLDHFQKNYRSMAFQSFFGEKTEKEKSASGFWDALLQNEGLAAVLRKLSGFAASKAASFLESWLEKWSAKKG